MHADSTNAAATAGATVSSSTSVNFPSVCRSTVAVHNFAVPNLCIRTDRIQLPRTVRSIMGPLLRVYICSHHAGNSQLCIEGSHAMGDTGRFAVSRAMQNSAATPASRRVSCRSWPLSHNNRGQCISSECSRNKWQWWSNISSSGRTDSQSPPAVASQLTRSHRMGEHGWFLRWRRSPSTTSSPLSPIVKGLSNLLVFVFCIFFFVACLYPIQTVHAQIDLESIPKYVVHPQWVADNCLELQAAHPECRPTWTQIASPSLSSSPFPQVAVHSESSYSQEMEPVKFTPFLYRWCPSESQNQQDWQPPPMIVVYCEGHPETASMVMHWSQTDDGNSNSNSETESCLASHLPEHVSIQRLGCSAASVYVRWKPEQLAQMQVQNTGRIDGLFVSGPRGLVRHPTVDRPSVELTMALPRVGSQWHVHRPGTCAPVSIPVPGCDVPDLYKWETLFLRPPHSDWDRYIVSLAWLAMVTIHHSFLLFGALRKNSALTAIAYPLLLAFFIPVLVMVDKNTVGQSTIAGASLPLLGAFLRGVWTALRRGGHKLRIPSQHTLLNVRDVFISLSGLLILAALWTDSPID